MEQLLKQFGAVEQLLKQFEAVEQLFNGRSVIEAVWSSREKVGAVGAVGRRAVGWSRSQKVRRRAEEQKSRRYLSEQP